MNNRTRASTGLAALIALTATTTVSGAMLVREVPFERVVLTSERIVAGVVSDKRSFWSDNGALLWTELTLRVVDILKGPADAPELVITQLGGEDPESGLALEIVGMPRPNKGDELVVFTDGTPNLHCPYLGCRQGIFYLAETDWSDGRRIVLDGMRRVVSALEGTRVEAAGGPAKHITAHDFFNAIRSLLSRAEADQGASGP